MPLSLRNLLISFSCSQFLFEIPEVLSLPVNSNVSLPPPLPLIPADTQMLGRASAGGVVRTVCNRISLVVRPSAFIQMVRPNTVSRVSTQHAGMTSYHPGLNRST